MMTAKQVLNGAAVRLARKGWLQGCYAVTAEDVQASSAGRKVRAGSPCGARGNLLGTEVGATDVIGALRQMSRWSPGNSEAATDDAVDEAKAILRRFLGVENLADWNDEEGRTKEQVIAALKGAAAKA